MSNTTIPQPLTIDATIAERLRAFDVKRMALFVEIYAAGRADALCEPHEYSSAGVTMLLDRIHNAWMDSLCATSAGLLPFDDSRERRAAPAWLLKAQEGTAER